MTPPPTDSRPDDTADAGADAGAGNTRDGDALTPQGLLPETEAGRARRFLVQVPLVILLLGAVVSVAADALLIGPVFRGAQLELAEETRTLVVGASHAACAFDPAVLGGPDADGAPSPLGPVVNAARHGELMLSTLAKLERLLDDNPQVERVVLAFSPIHVAQWQDIHLLGGVPEARAQLLEYYPLYGPWEREQLTTVPDVFLARLKYDAGVPLDFTEDTGVFVRHLAGRLAPEQYRFWGGYTGLGGSHLEQRLLDHIVEKYFVVDGAEAGVSERAVAAVERLVERTRARGVALALVDTPVHPRFAARVPALHRDVHAEVLAEVAARFPEARLLRHGDLPVPDDHFLDPDHQNRAGARAYGALVREELAR